jgi:hypothetical protein
MKRAPRTTKGLAFSTRHVRGNPTRPPRGGQCYFPLPDAMKRLAVSSRHRGRGGRSNARRRVARGERAPPRGDGSGRPLPPGHPGNGTDRSALSRSPSAWWTGAAEPDGHDPRGGDGASGRHPRPRPRPHAEGPARGAHGPLAGRPGPARPPRPVRAGQRVPRSRRSGQAAGVRRRPHPAMLSPIGRVAMLMPGLVLRRVKELHARRAGWWWWRKCTRRGRPPSGESRAG